MFKSRRGFTLIEIMVTVAVIALIMGLTAFTLQDLFGEKISTTADQLSGTIKYVYNEAAVKNQYYRLLIDFGARTFSVESAEDPFKIVATPDGTPDDPSVGSEPKASTAPNTDANAPEPEPEGAAQVSFNQETNFLLKPIEIPSGVRIKDVYVEHYGKKVESGKVAIYFFPNGWVEKAVINLTDEKEESFYSIEVFPATGRSKIRSEYFEYKPEDEKK